MPPTPLSGYALEKLKWEKKGLEWWKGLSKITYDGCDWLYFDFPNCIKEKYGEGIEIVPRKIYNVKDLNDK